MLWFKNFRVLNRFVYRGGVEREGVSRYSIEVICLALPKNFLGAPFNVSLISGIEKIFG